MELAEDCAFRGSINLRRMRRLGFDTRKSASPRCKQACVRAKIASIACEAKTRQALAVRDCLCLMRFGRHPSNPAKHRLEDAPCTPRPSAPNKFTIGSDWYWQLHPLKRRTATNRHRHHRTSDCLASPAIRRHPANCGPEGRYPPIPPGLTIGNCRVDPTRARSSYSSNRRRNQ